MLIYDGKEFRNLEEQVQKNKEDIARHYEIDRVIADLGIRVLGKVPTVQDLPASSAAYGDAYFIGDTSQMYVWTRANELIGEMQPYWLDIGNVFIAGPEGPEGPEGPQGERGERGSRWFAGNQLPTTASEYIEGDMFVLLGAGVPQSNVGNVYRFDGYSFTYYQNIRGPQGIQGLRGIQGERGIQGPQGEVGPQGPASGIVNVVGTVSNAASLPSPSVLNDLKSAYLVGTQAPYQLYIQVGTTPANAVWVNQGYLQNTDDKVTIDTRPYKVYATSSSGTQYLLNWSQSETAGSVAVRGINGIVKVGPAVDSNDAVQKAQLPKLYRHNIYMINLSNDTYSTVFSFISKYEYSIGNITDLFDKMPKYFAAKISGYPSGDKLFTGTVTVEVYDYEVWITGVCVDDVTSNTAVKLFTDEVLYWLEDEIEIYDTVTEI